MKEDVGDVKTRKACEQGWKANKLTQNPKLNKPLSYNLT